MYRLKRPSGAGQMFVDIQETFVIGNTNDISEPVLNVFPNPTRISGNDKYGTNLAILEWFKEVFNFDTVFMATGNDYPDALTGAAYASRSGSPIILVDRKVDSRIVEFFAANYISQLIVLGGENAISFSLIKNYVEKSSPTYSATEISKLLANSVVYIETYDNFGKVFGSGSGFVVDESGKIATNFYVIVKINATGLKPVTLGDSDNINTGERIYAIGVLIASSVYT